MTESHSTSPDRRYWTPAHIRAAVTPTGVVLLDMRKNRYSGISQRDASQLAALSLNWTSIATGAHSLPSHPREDALVRAGAFMQVGLLSDAPMSQQFETRQVNLNSRLASVGLEEQTRIWLRPHHLINFARACLWAKRALRRRTLYSIACELSAQRAALPAPMPERVIELVCVFRRLRPLAFEAREKCLFHALALERFLMRYGCYATWVIGVTARPWAAHSWLQLEHRLLDANPEDVCSFTPILTV